MSIVALAAWVVAALMAGVAYNLLAPASWNFEVLGAPFVGGIVTLAILIAVSLWRPQ